MLNMTNKLKTNSWRLIAQIDLGDFLTLEDVRQSYLQNYVDKGYTEVKFEPLGCKKYKVYLKREVPVSRIAIVSVKIKLLKAQLKNYPDKKKEILNEISFWQIALKNYRKGLKLADWEVGLPENLRQKMRDRKYLPIFSEANKIPYKQRESYQEEFFDYEIWNREYIKTLAKQIGRGLILEVGSGTGRLSYFLQQELPKSKIFATDISLKHKIAGIPLVKMSMKQALQKFHPDVILCSWPDEFFWKEIKYNSRAKKIILIGDIEDTPLAKEVKGKWTWLKIKRFQAKECTACEKVQTSRDSLGTTVIYSLH